MAAAQRIVVVGGHGKVALHFARLASSRYSVESLVRSEDHFSDITSRGASPVLLSLEDASTAELTSKFQGARAVVFSAGAGGKGGAERTNAVDYLGAVKTFDAIEKVEGQKPALFLVSAIDTRDLEKPAPPHYNADDLEASKKGHQAIGAYYDAKLKADRDLVKRTAFDWTILRPGHLEDGEGTGKVQVGQTHIGGVPREDVAATLLELISLPGKGSSGLALDLIKGETSISEAVRSAVDKGVSDFFD
ncbi:NADH(P)-binding-domain-containing protein [Leucosporidium creatinivorum]|uniref:NADH(P)-binding-domain-containing protein n=1 Tax=Leucosporidium creatinivorum TaxID=106004 RepID=A0A1Y2FXV8_9BASI|nr:NADH(P)-binding-domain-containing protein [Leucosporidium creatinivorum]